MGYFLSEYIYFGMYILFGMDAHCDPTSHDILNELVHSIFDFFAVFCFLYVPFYFIKEFFLGFFF